MKAKEKLMMRLRAKFAVMRVNHEVFGEKGRRLRFPDEDGDYHYIPTPQVPEVNSIEMNKIVEAVVFTMGKDVQQFYLDCSDDEYYDVVREALQ